MELMLRPFERYLEFPESHVEKITGVLDGDTFVFSAMNFRIAFIVKSKAADRFGDFAILEPQDKSLNEGWECHLEAYQDDSDEEPGASLSLKLPGDLSPYAAEALRRGRDLTQINLLVPDRAGFSIFFNFCGFVDGHSGPQTVTHPYNGSEEQRKPN